MLFLLVSSSWDLEHSSMHFPLPPSQIKSSNLLKDPVAEPLETSSLPSTSQITNEE